MSQEGEEIKMEGPFASVSVKCTQDAEGHAKIVIIGRDDGGKLVKASAVAVADCGSSQELAIIQFPSFD